MLNWCKRFNIFCFLDNHNYCFTPPRFDWILAADVAADKIICPSGNAFSQLDNFRAQNNDWLFGHLSYDLKNEIEKLSSKLPDNIGFPDLHFFVPKILIICNGGEISIESLDFEPTFIVEGIHSAEIIESTADKHLKINNRLSKEQYLATVRQLKKHIHRGDCYEINFCQEFYAEGADINPLDVYRRLSSISPNPFSCFYKLDDRYLCCASPERYIIREGDKILSQPIKGTIQRDLQDCERDNKLKNQLLSSEKERAENVMIVDLVRNDLSKVSKRGSVHVQELFGIYKFPQVYQMISTVAATVEDRTSVGEIIRATFPMGSMTGAPKKRVMELIEQYELTRRGLFSGSVGYITPDGDFDFNVVIRSIQYNSTSKYLSFSTGSAITFSSDAEQEYDECLLKAAAMMKVLSSEN
jgi:para-aminobenzoate synthetase component I